MLKQYIAPKGVLGSMEHSVSLKNWDSFCQISEYWGQVENLHFLTSFIYAQMMDHLDYATNEENPVTAGEQIVQ